MTQPLHPIFVLLFLSLVLQTACVNMQLDAEPTALDFDAVELGTAGFMETSVTLSQSAPANLSYELQPPDGDFFIDVMPRPVLDEAGVVTLRLGFHPSRLDEQTATLNIRATNPEGEASVAIALKGQGAASTLDLDRDGFSEPEDCDDADASRNPSALEVCDGVDNDCDGALGIDEQDGDGDGVAPCDGDCDDAAATIYPGAEELCDGLDNDCDGDVGEVDEDGDGVLACEGDCDDSDPLTLPGGGEYCDGVDNNCDGELPPEESDGDGDGVSPCAGDCDDASAASYPGASELCDGVDNDCDTIVPAIEFDSDADGVRVCDGDCDDSEPLILPGAVELCDGLDNDCDGLIPADDQDGDGDSISPCAGDCDDNDVTVAPGLLEECFDLADQNCDGQVNEGCSCPIWVGPQPNSSCSSPGEFDCPHPTIEAGYLAEEATAVCEEVWILPGTYNESLSLSGSAVLIGAGAPGDVIIEPPFGRAVLVDVDALVELSGLTISGGLAGDGAGLFARPNSNLTVTNSQFVDNTCTSGGRGAGAFLNYVDFYIAETTFEGNDCGYGASDAQNDAGGLFIVGGNGVVADSLFVGNSAGDASDLMIRSTAGTDLVSVRNNAFFDGSTDDVGSPIGEWKGGAVVIQSQNVLFENNLVAGHDASEGSWGVLLPTAYSTTQVSNNVIIGGSSGDGGGGIQLDWNPASTLPGEIVGNIVASGVGSGIVSEASSLPSSTNYNNSWDNSVDDFSTLSSSLPIPIDSISADPLFVAWSNDGDWTNDDFSLLVGSPSIDSGHPSVPGPDLDGSPTDQGIFGGPSGDWIPAAP